jgi:hypothetical protein
VTGCQYGMIELSRYVFEAPGKDEEFILYRGRSKDGASQVLAISPAAEYPTPESLKRLEHEYSLREELDPASGLKSDFQRCRAEWESRGDSGIAQASGL